MNTNNIFLRFYEDMDGEEVGEVYESIANVISNGVPIITSGEHEGDEMQCDGKLHREIGGQYYLELD